MGKLLFFIAWRNLCRNKLTSAIQLGGLVIGLGVFILIQLYVRHEYSVNSQFSEAADIFRVALIRDTNKPQAQTPLRLAQELKDNFSAITDATRVSIANVSIELKGSTYAEQVLFADANYFDFFDFSLLEGDITTALKSPDSIVIYQDTAEKYFGRTTGVLGNAITVNSRDYRITAVIKRSDIPHTMPLTLILPIERYFTLLNNPDWVVQWNFTATRTFVKIKDKGFIGGLTVSASDYYNQRAAGLTSYKSHRIQFEPLKSIYLNNQTTRSLSPPGSGFMVNVFNIVSYLILLLAIINFSNLATAAAMRRSKDVGVRKALGASYWQLVGQYLAESFLLTLISALGAVLFSFLTLDAFNQLMLTNIQLSASTENLIGFALLVFVIGILSGAYPALFLSRFNASIALKGLTKVSTSGLAVKRALVVLQFSIAVFLIAISSVINLQMLFVNAMPQGFERKNVIVINEGGDIYDGFKQRALAVDGVTSVTMSHTVPTKATRTSHTVRKLNDLATEFWAGNNPVSLDYFSAYGIKLMAGRVFSQFKPQDAYQENKQDISRSTGSLIINQTLARQLGWSSSQAIGKRVALGGNAQGLHEHEIIGVVEDTHYTNAKNNVPPMTYVLSEHPSDLGLRWTTVKLSDNAGPATIQQLIKVWHDLAPAKAFKYDLLSDLFDANYRNETLQATLVNLFTTIALIVTLFGLFALAAFDTQRRTKEVAIRRILGASRRQVCMMLMNDFIILVIIANLIALPIAYLYAEHWLNGFTYRISMPYLAFLGSCLVTIFVGYVTVGVIAIRSAQTKPAKALHYE